MTLIPYNEEDYNHMQSYLIPNNMEDAKNHETFFLELENIVSNVKNDMNKIETDRDR